MSSRFWEVRARPERRALSSSRTILDMWRRAKEESSWNAQRDGCHVVGNKAARPSGVARPALAGFGIAGFWALLASAPAWAQPPQPFVPEISERSGLLMRFASTPEVLPPDPHRDSFYNTRYADSGTIKHPNWFATQGLYGLGMKTPATQSIYPYFYGNPGRARLTRRVGRGGARPGSSRV